MVNFFQEDHKEAMPQVDDFPVYIYDTSSPNGIQKAYACVPDSGGDVGWLFVLNDAENELDIKDVAIANTCIWCDDGGELSEVLDTFNITN